jgi:hypothetical protein
MAVVYPRNLDMTLIFGVSGTVLPIEKHQAMVSINVADSVDWAGLVPATSKAPGYFQRFIYDRPDGIITTM